MSGGDSLTRTTLEIGGTLPRTIVDDATRALRRVPGVLLADLNPANTRVVVAHDGAVHVTALVSAAASAGAPTTVVRDRLAVATPANATPAATALVPIRKRTLIAAMVSVAVVLILIDLLLPDSAMKRLVLNGLVIGVWICFFAGFFVRSPPEP